MRRSGFKGLVAAGVVTAGIAASTSIVAASDMFLKITNIQGESADSKHKGEIDVLAWSWGTSAGTARTTRGAVPGSCIQDLSLTKMIDSATPAFITMGVTGEVAADAVLTVRRVTGEGYSADYFTLRMSNVSVSAYQTGGSGGENMLTENVVLHFDSLKGDYRPQKADGSAGSPIAFEISGACR
jgi:type VI secretion system secreted protein Hcp